MSIDKTGVNVSEGVEDLSSIILRSIKNECPNMMPEMEFKIKVQLFLAEFQSTRLVVGTCVICSNAKEIKSKSFTKKVEMLQPSFGSAISRISSFSIIEKLCGNICAQKQLELCHKDIDFFPRFEGGKVCAVCKPEIENNEWQGYYLYLHNEEIGDLHIRLVEIQEIGGLSLCPSSILIQSWDDKHLYLEDITGPNPQKKSGAS